MSRLGLFAGTVIDRAIDWAEHLAPTAAFKAKRHFYRPDMQFGLRLLSRCGFSPSTVIDVGAFKGEWAGLCRAVFPQSRVLMIEPVPDRVRQLQERCARDPNLSVLQALVGSSECNLSFVEQESNSHVTAAPRAESQALPSKPLDALVRDTPFARSELIKIDAQGYDLEIIKGATVTLRSAEVVIIELSLIPLHSFAPTLRDAIDALDDRGFRLFDICSFIRRPVDDTLWQLDAMFVPKDSPLGNPAQGW